jgi:hypothetical protein
MGQTNKQQRHFNEWPVSELRGEVDSIQTYEIIFFLFSNNGMSSLLFSSISKLFLFASLRSVVQTFLLTGEWCWYIGGLEVEQNRTTSLLIPTPPLMNH